MIVKGLGISGVDLHNTAAVPAPPVDRAVDQLPATSYLPQRATRDVQSLRPRVPLPQRASTDSTLSGGGVFSSLEHLKHGTPAANSEPARLTHSPTSTPEAAQAGTDSKDYGDIPIGLEHGDIPIMLDRTPEVRVPPQRMSERQRTEAQTLALDEMTKLIHQNFIGKAALRSVELGARMLPEEQARHREAVARYGREMPAAEAQVLWSSFGLRSTRKQP